MGAFKASLMLLKIGDGEVPETFTTIGGFRQYEMKVNQQLLGATDLDDSAWRNLQNASGARSVSIVGNGIYADNSTEQQLRNAALTGAIAQYQFCFANGDVLQGPFMLQEYYRGGNLEGEEVFRVMLESAGELQLL